MLKASIHDPYRGKPRPSVDDSRGTVPFARRSILPALLALVFFAILCTLGFWQLHRADEKRELQSQYDQRGSQPPMVLGSTIRSADELQFFRIEARGYYDNDYSVLIDNRVHQGVPGYHAVTALRIDGGDTRVLVNRGWVPLGVDRAHPPSVTPPKGRVTVTGIGVVPHAGFTLGALDALRAESPAVWQQLDLARYAAETGRELQPIVILLDPESGAGGFVREWARLDTGISVHQAYAFQWFMLAATVVVIYFWRVRASRRRDAV